MQVEYAYYLLAVLVIGLSCLVAARVATRSRDRVLRDYHRHREQASRQLRNAHRKAAGRVNGVKPSDRRTMPAAIPWGWRGSSRRALKGRDRGWGGTLRGFARQLLRKKQLAVPAASDPRHSQSIRALLEDRYGRIRRDTMTEIAYRKVKVPRFHDVDELPDQLSDMSTSAKAPVRRKLQQLRPVGSTSGPRRAGQAEARVNGLKDIKLPWGW